MERHVIAPQELPRFSDKLSYLYAEHAAIDQEEHAIAICRADGVSLMPAAALGVLLLGPGCTVTHAAIHTLAENGCLVLWVGEHGVRYYAQGMGLARSARNLQRQAMMASQPLLRLQVVVRMYCKRFAEKVEGGTTLQQLRGREGIRVRETYAQAARTYGVEWKGRSYRREEWDWSDPVNRALSAGNSCLYGLVHAAILSGGYSPGLGFVHCGKQLSFVYDVADLYKAELVIPLAFRLAASPPPEKPLESAMRHECRNLFRQERLMERVLPDIAEVLDLTAEEQQKSVEEYQEDEALPAEWWSPAGFGATTPISEILAGKPGGAV